MRHSFIWMVTSTCIIMECGHPRTFTCTRKWAFIYRKWVYGVPCLVSELLPQSSSIRWLLLNYIDGSSLISSLFLKAVKLMPGSNLTMHMSIPHRIPCNFFHFLLIDWFSLVCTLTQSRLISSRLLFVGPQKLRKIKFQKKKLTKPISLSTSKVELSDSKDLHFWNITCIMHWNEKDHFRARGCKKYWFYRKMLQTKVAQNSISKKKPSVDAYLYLHQEWSQGASKIWQSDLIRSSIWKWTDTILLFHSYLFFNYY